MKVEGAQFEKRKGGTFGKIESMHDIYSREYHNEAHYFVQ